MDAGARALVVGLALCASAVAAADPTPEAKARALQLFDEGRAAVKAGDFARACDRFEKSYALEPAPGTEMNIGDCSEKQGQLRKAWKMFDAAARELTDARAAFAHQRADKLRAQLVMIVVKIAAPLPAGLALTIDRHAEPATADVHDIVEPGAIEVVATAPDKAAITRTATGAAGGTVHMELAFVGEAGGGAVAEPDKPEPEKPEQPVHEHAAAAERDGGERRPSWVHAALGIGGVGLAVEAAGLGFGFAARSAHQDALTMGCTQIGDLVTCQPGPGAASETHAGKLADIGTVLTIGGAAMLAAGVIVYFAAPRTAEDVHVAPIAGAHVVGISVGRAF